MGIHALQGPFLFAAFPSIFIGPAQIERLALNNLHIQRQTHLHQSFECLLETFAEFSFAASPDPNQQARKVKYLLHPDPSTDRG